MIISILDNGGGIPTGTINRIFEPYFTTKHKTQGKGISLYLIEEIVVNLFKGKISVENRHFTFEENEFYGANFKITIVSK